MFQALLELAATGNGLDPCLSPGLVSQVTVGLKQIFNSEKSQAESACLRCPPFINDGSGKCNGMCP